LRRARGKTCEAVFETDGSELGASFARAEELSDDVLAAIEGTLELGILAHPGVERSLISADLPFCTVKTLPVQ
jgi:hypothetical protein